MQPCRCFSRRAPRCRARRSEGEASFESMEAPVRRSRSPPSTRKPPRKRRPRKAKSRCPSPSRNPRKYAAPAVELDAIVVTLRREDQIRDLVSQARELLEDHELQYVFTGKRQERNAPRPPGGLCAVERVGTGLDRRAHRDPPPAGELEAGRQAPEVHPAHAGHPGAAHQGHGRRAADVRLLEGRRAAQGLRPEVPGVRRRADQEEALAGGRRNREAHRLPAVHGRHLRSRLRQRRPGFPAGDRPAGHRRVAPGQGAFSRVPRRAARRCRARLRHRDARRDRADRRRGLRREGRRGLQRGAEPVRPEARRGVPLQRLQRVGHRPDAVHEPQGQRHLFHGGPALSRGAARPELRARRDGPAERHEGGHLPVRHRAEADARGDPRRVPRQPGSPGHFPGGRLQRRAPERHEARTAS